LANKIVIGLEAVDVEQLFATKDNASWQFFVEVVGLIFSPKLVRHSVFAQPEELSRLVSDVRTRCPIALVC